MRSLNVAIVVLLAMFIVLIGIASAQASFYAVDNVHGKVEPASSEQIRSMIHQAKNAWIKGDADAFASLFTADGEFVVPGNRWVGQEKIRQVAADFAAGTSAVTIEIRRIIIEADQAAVEWHWQDTDSAGRQNQADDVIVVDFVGNQISRWREYIDAQSLQLDQSGLGRFTLWQRNF